MLSRFWRKSEEIMIKPERREFKIPLDNDWFILYYIQKTDMDFRLIIHYEKDGKEIYCFDQSSHNVFHVDYLDNKLKEFPNARTTLGKVETTFDFIKNELNSEIRYGDKCFVIPNEELEEMKKNILKELDNPKYGTRTTTHSIGVNAVISPQKK
jgi:hypothetical protein